MNDVAKGLYRRYDNEYVIVLGTMYNEMTELMVRYALIDSDVELCMRASMFLSDTYEYTIVTEKGVDTEYRLIEKHPNNCTGQKTCFMKIVDLESFGANLSTEALVEELQKRWDSPLHDFDIEDFNSRVWCREYVVGVPKDSFMFNGVERPANVEVKSICDTFEEAQTDLVKYKVMGNNVKVYRRVYVEEKGVI